MSLSAKSAFRKPAARKTAKKQGAIVASLQVEHQESEKQFWFEGLKIWQIDCLDGDEEKFFKFCCEIFPSITAHEDDDTAAWYDEADEAWVTYSSSRRVYEKHGVAFFGDVDHWDNPYSEGGSYNAAWQLVALLQKNGMNAKIYFASDAGCWRQDENMMYVADVLIPEHFAWGYGYEWRDEINQEKEIQSETDRLMDIERDNFLGFRYIGEGYYESLNPNDYLFYTADMLPQDLWQQWRQIEWGQVKRNEIEAQVRALMAPYSPYAKAFEKLVDMF